MALTNSPPITSALVGAKQIWLIRLSFVVLALGIAAAQTKKTSKTNAEIRQEIIKQSIASYKGSCPCPYSVDRAGRMCGRRSAYSKPGGASPLCYEKDVTQKMVEDYRKRTAP
jgi:hypothetical protein